jgi:hypothetical protein
MVIQTAEKHSDVFPMLRDSMSAPPPWYDWGQGSHLADAFPIFSVDKFGQSTDFSIECERFEIEVVPLFIIRPSGRGFDGSCRNKMLTQRKAVCMI